MSNVFKKFQKYATKEVGFVTHIPSEVPYSELDDAQKAEEGELLQRLLDARVRMDFLARNLDQRYIDPILGIIPAIGDMVGVVPALYQMFDALRSGMWKSIPWIIFAHSKDIGIGSIPLAGDIYDIFKKSYVDISAIFLNEEQERIKQLENRGFPPDFITQRQDLSKRQIARLIKSVSKASSAKI